MTIDTPAWARDAVFYQVFPDRFASSPRVAKPGAARALGRPADQRGLQGRRPARAGRAPRRARRPRDHGALSQPRLRGRVEPSLQRVRLLRGGSAARRRRRAARAARRGPRPRHPGRPRRRLQPRRAGILAVPPRARDGRARRRTATGSTSSRRCSPAVAALHAYGVPRGGPDGRARLPVVVGRPGAAEAPRRASRRCASTCSRSRSTGSDSGSTAGGSTCPRTSRTRRSGRSSAGASGPSTRRRTSSARSGTRRRSGSAGDRFDALMNYPLGIAILGFVGGASLDHAGHRRPVELRPSAGRRSTGRRSVGRSSASWRCTTRPSPPSSTTSSAATTRRGLGPSWAGRRRGSGWRRSSS